MLPFILMIIFSALVAPHETACASVPQSLRDSLLLPLPDHCNNPGRLVGLDPKFSPADTPGTSWGDWFTEWEKHRICGQVVLVRKYADPQQDGLYYYFDTAGYEIPRDRYVARYNVVCEDGNVQFIPVPVFPTSEPQGHFIHQQVIHPVYQHLSLAYQQMPGSPFVAGTFPYPVPTYPQIPQYAAPTYPPMSSLASSSRQIPLFSAAPSLVSHAPQHRLPLPPLSAPAIHAAPLSLPLPPLPLVVASSQLSPQAHHITESHETVSPMSSARAESPSPLHSPSPDITFRSPHLPATLSPTAEHPAADAPQEKPIFVEKKNDTPHIAIQADAASLAPAASATRNEPSSVLNSSPSVTPAHVVIVDHRHKGERQKRQPDTTRTPAVPAQQHESKKAVPGRKREEQAQERQRQEDIRQIEYEATLIRQREQQEEQERQTAALSRKQEEERKALKQRQAEELQAQEARERRDAQLQQERLQREIAKETARKKKEAAQQREIERTARYAALIQQVTDATDTNDFSKAWRLTASIEEENPTLYRQQLLSLVQHEQAPDILVSAVGKLLALKNGRNKGLVIQAASDRRALLGYLLRYTSKEDRGREALLKQATDLGMLSAGLEWHLVQMNSHQGSCRGGTCVHTKAQTFLEQHAEHLDHTLMRYQTMVAALLCSQKRAQASAALQELLTQAETRLPAADHATITALVQPLLPAPTPVGPPPPTRQQQEEARREAERQAQRAYQEQEQEINARHAATLEAMKGDLEAHNFQAACQKAKEHLVSLMQDPTDETSVGAAAQTTRGDNFQYALAFIRQVDQARQADACLAHQVALLLALQETVNHFRLHLPLSQLEICMKFFNKVKLSKVGQDSVASLARQTHAELSHILNPQFIAIAQLWSDFSQIPGGPDQRNRQRVLVTSRISKLMQQITTDDDARKLVQSLINFRTAPENLFTILAEETIACRIHQLGQQNTVQQTVAAQRYIFANINNAPSLFLSYAYRVFNKKAEIPHKLQGLLALATNVIGAIKSPTKIAEFLHILNLYTNEDGPFGFIVLMKSALREHSKDSEPWQAALAQEQDEPKRQLTWRESLSDMCTIQ